jgi:pimeloyl-ACP methyl ester carboxylesterase
MGGYIAFEIMRQAPQRVLKLALMDTGARPETAEQTARRQGPMAMARAGKWIEVADESFVFFVHPNRHGDVALRDTVRAMAEETGVEAHVSSSCLTAATCRRSSNRRPSPKPWSSGCRRETAGLAARTRRHSMSDIDAGR